MRRSRFRIRNDVGCRGMSRSGYPHDESNGVSRGDWDGALRGHDSKGGGRQPGMEPGRHGCRRLFNGETHAVARRDQEISSRAAVQCLQEASLPRRLDSIVQPEVLARMEIVKRSFTKTAG